MTKCYRVAYAGSVALQCAIVIAFGVALFSDYWIDGQTDDADWPTDIPEFYSTRQHVGLWSTCITARNVNQTVHYCKTFSSECSYEGNPPFYDASFLSHNQMDPFFNSLFSLSDNRARACNFLTAVQILSCTAFALATLTLLVAFQWILFEGSASSQSILKTTAVSLMVVAGLVGMAAMIIFDVMLKPVGWSTGDSATPNVTVFESFNYSFSFAMLIVGWAAQALNVLLFVCSTRQQPAQEEALLQAPSVVYA